MWTQFTSSLHHVSTSLEQFRFLSWIPCVCVSGVKEREPVLKTAGRGGRRGADRAACEFLFYCLTLLKKKKKIKRIKCFDPFWHFALAAAFCHSSQRARPGLLARSGCPHGLQAQSAIPRGVWVPGGRWGAGCPLKNLFSTCMLSRPWGCCGAQPDASHGAVS